jgi:hypothetical protein
LDGKVLQIQGVPGCSRYYPGTVHFKVIPTQHVPGRSRPVPGFNKKVRVLKLRFQACSMDLPILKVVK